MPTPVVLTDVNDVPVGDSTNPLVVSASGLTTEVEAVATAAAPTYSEGTLNPLSQTLGGALRVDVVAGGGGGGTSSNFGSAFPAVGTAVGFKDSSGTNMVAGNLDSSGNLKVNVAAGSGSNAAASATGSAVPASASYTGLNFSGNLAGWTAVQPSGSIIAGQVDIASVAGTTVATGHGTAAGALRVELPTDGTGKVTVAQATASSLNATVIGSGTAGAAASGVVTVQGIASMTPVQVSQATASNLNAAVVGTGTAGTPAGGILTVQGATSMTKILVTPDSVALPANQSVNLSQVNGVTTLTGAGASGTGAQRCTVSQDTTTLAGSAPGTAGAASANVVTVQGVASMTPVQVSQATASNLNATVVGTGTFSVQNTAALVAGSNLVGKVGIDQTTPGTTNNVTSVGPTASGSSLTANPVTRGGLAKTANPTAVSDGQVVNALHDKLGKLVVVGAIRDLKGQQATTITASTSETTIVTAVASTFLDLYGLVLTNSSATATVVTIKDSTAGTTRMTIAVPAGDTRGFMLDPGAAMNQASVNNNWTATSSASITSLYVTALFVKNI